MGHGGELGTEVWSGMCDMIWSCNGDTVLDRAAVF